MGGKDKGLRMSLGAFLLACFIWAILVGLIADGARTSATTIIISSRGIIRDSKFTGKQRNAAHKEKELNYVNKRRVPNGPDPIHNRRAGKSRQPPDGI